MGKAKREKWKKKQEEIISSMQWWNNLTTEGREKILIRLWKRRMKK